MPSRVAYAAAIFGLLGLPSLAREPGPLCGHPEVLEQVAEILARRGSPARIEAGGVGEVPTSDQRIVRCAVRLTSRFYDTDRYGYAPQHQASVFQYLVRAGQNGLFVSAADGLD